MAQDETLLDEMVQAATTSLVNPTDTMDNNNDSGEEHTETTITVQAIGASETQQPSLEEGMYETPFCTPKENATINKPTTNLLDGTTFAHALTHDVKLYDIQNEVSLATNIENIFKHNNPLSTTDATIKRDNSTGKQEAYKRGEEATVYQEQSQLIRRWTLPAIDITAGNYKSKRLIVLLWATILVTYFAYMHDFNRTYAVKCDGDNSFQYYYVNPWGQNAAAMGCEVVNSILGWLDEFWNMSWFGILFVSLGSIGNSVDCSRAWKPMVGFFFVLFLVVGNPLVAVLVMKETNEEKIVGYAFSMLLGIVTASLHLAHAASISLSEETWKKIESCLPQIYRMFSSTVFEETNVKQAGARKLARLIKNALEVVKAKNNDNVLATHYGTALANYAAKASRKYEETGGMMWAWRRVLGRGKNPFVNEGIWLPARMIAGNIAQYVVIFWVLLGGIRLTNIVIADYDEEWAKETFRNLTDKAFDAATTDQLANDLAGNITLCSPTTCLP